MRLDETLARAEKEIAEGRLWRAKELLKSNLRSHGYQIKLYRKLADVLMQMGDAPAAGKYLFLSVDNPDEEQQAAVDVFLERFSQRGYSQLYHTFPQAARLQAIADYPTFAQATFRKLKAPEHFRAEDKFKSRSSIGIDWGCLISIFAFVFVVSCFLVGFWKILDWIVSLF